MVTALVSHDDCLDHVTPDGHPEQVARYRAVQDALSNTQFDNLARHAAPMGTQEQVTLAHPVSHYDRIQAATPSSDYVSLDADTHMSPGSFHAALRAVGGVCHAVDLVLDAQAQNAFCATRPPGHHAERETPMGFCLFGTVAIGAKYALDQRGLNRVAIVDFDVHHGNGTQDLVWDDARIYFASTHQMPLYPGTGAATQTGAHGNVLNIPLAAGSDGSKLMTALERQILPALIDHKPEMLFISAGFDAHRADPLAGLNFDSNDFAQATQILCEFAREQCAGRIVSTLEGGYDLPALGQSVAAHVTALMEG